MPLSLEISESGLPDGARLIVDPKDRDLMDMRERMLLKTWHQARFRSGRLPKRSDLGKALLPGVLGFVLDVAIKPNGAFQFSSYGFEIARAFGKKYDRKLRQ